MNPEGATHALFAWRLQGDLSTGQDTSLAKMKEGGNFRFHQNPAPVRSV